MKRKLKCTPTRTTFPPSPSLSTLSPTPLSARPNARSPSSVFVHPPERPTHSVWLNVWHSCHVCVCMCVCRLRCLTLKNEQVQSHSCTASGSDANVDVDCKAGNDFRPRRKMKFTKIFRRLCFCCCCCCRRKMFCSKQRSSSSSNSAACL